MDMKSKFYYGGKPIKYEILCFHNKLYTIVLLHYLQLF